jgi:hypothetical protein
VKVEPERFEKNPRNSNEQLNRSASVRENAHWTESWREAADYFDACSRKRNEIGYTGMAIGHRH